MDKMINQARAVLEMQDTHLRSYQSMQKAADRKLTWAQGDAFENRVLYHYREQLVCLHMLDEVCDAISITETLLAMGVGKNNDGVC